MDDHLTCEEVDLLFAGLLEPVASRRVVRHLVSGCAECQARFLEAAEAKPPLCEAEEQKLSDLTYDGTIDRAVRLALDEMPRWEQEREQRDRLLTKAKVCLDGLLGLPEEEEDFHGWALVEALLAECREERFRDLQRMRLLAFAATVAARNLDPQLYGRAAIHDLSARAFAELANANRLNDEFEIAEDALIRAKGCLANGTGDPLTLARLLEVEVSLRSDQKRLTEALELLRALHQLYIKLGEAHLAGQTLISQGINMAVDCHPDEAVSLFREALSLIEAKRDPQLAAIGRYGLLNALEMCGEYREAGRFLLASGLREAFADDPLNLAKLSWLEGKIQAGLGKLRRAEQILSEVRRYYLEHGQEYDAALVGLDLAGVWLQQEKHAAVRELAQESLEAFASLGIRSEGLKALRYFCEACQ